MPTNFDAVKLQLAMAFGQGAGCMLASTEALETLLADQSTIITSAMGDWDSSHWAFIDLVRRLGQMSAVRAAVGGSAVIRPADIAASLPGVMEICPCLDRPGRKR